MWSPHTVNFAKDFIVKRVYGKDLREEKINPNQVLTKPGQKRRKTGTQQPGPHE